jgi:hypothetical protein
MIEFMEVSEGDVLCVRARGTLTSGDYRQVLAPQLESLVQRFGSVRVLFLMDEPFQGWDLGGLAGGRAALERSTSRCIGYRPGKSG